MNILLEDLSKINQVEFIDWEQLRKKTFFITGATGLIGKTLIKTLLFVNEKRNLGLHIIALVRDIKKAKQVFAEFEKNETLSFIESLIENFNQALVTESIDYIIHGASQTASKLFVEHAVETIDTALCGTKNMLELAKIKKVQTFVYLSSMEVYGSPKKGTKVDENHIGVFSPFNLRNSYPLSKIMCECMCLAYAKEYGVKTRVCRLAQTFGPGVRENDNRIFAYMGRCVKNKENIILKTDGKTERCYLYTADAVTAILQVLIKGCDGEAYNIADENTYCSIYDFAKKIANANGIGVKFDIQPSSNNGYPETLYMNLDTKKLKELGWSPIGGGVGIVEMINRMIL